MAMTVKTNDILTKFKEFADKAVKDKEVITISRPKNENVVMISESEFQEYARARRNAEYMRMLEQSNEEYREGRVIVKTMEELRAMEESM
ncbi:type II toxin-antitoxin system Phd/YefM family antitoxin [Eubacteriales bacterium OttesenSCG-928-A19]|nr:type II toxin-antitoxin system Phd/YefM family antitoxin [Eubacteriales bacterium OttesenSCG-928-A19]